MRGYVPKQKQLTKMPNKHSFDGYFQTPKKQQSTTSRPFSLYLQDQPPSSKGGRKEGRPTIEDKQSPPSQRGKEKGKDWLLWALDSWGERRKLSVSWNWEFEITEEK